MAPIDATYGAMFDGFVVSLLLYGITCGQYIHYLRVFRNKDSGFLRSYVMTVYALDTLHEILVIHALWHYLVSARLPSNAGYVLIANWSLIGQIVPTEINAISVEIIFIYRIWLLSHKSKLVFAFILPLVVSILFSSGYVIKCYLLPEFIYAGTYMWLLIVFASARMLTDIAIAVSMCCIVYFKLQSDIPSSRSASLIRKVVNFTVTTGVLSCLVSIVYLCVYTTMPLKMIYIGVYFSHSKLYVNSLLASLNARERLRAIANRSLPLRTINSSLLRPNSTATPFRLSTPATRTGTHTPTRTRNGQVGVGNNNTGTNAIELARLSPLSSGDGFDDDNDYHRPTGDWCGVVRRPSPSSFERPAREKAGEQELGEEQEEGPMKKAKKMALELGKDESGLGLGIGMWKVDSDASHRPYRPRTDDGDGDSAARTSRP